MPAAFVLSGFQLDQRKAPAPLEAVMALAAWAAA
jgi:hypothetical protein